MGKHAQPPHLCWCGILGVAVRGGQWVCLRHLAAPYSINRRILRPGIQGGLRMKRWTKAALLAALVLLPVVAQGEPVEQPCPWPQTWECEGYGTTRGWCGCKRWRDGVPVPVTVAPEASLLDLLRAIFEK
jgi:hypothetical protein